MEANKVAIVSEISDMAYKIICKARGVEWVYTGVLTGSELIESNEKIYGDPRFDDLRYQLVDLSQVERYEITEQDMKRMAFYDRVAAQSNPRIRLAVIAPRDEDRAITETYGSFNPDSVWALKI